MAGHRILPDGTLKPRRCDRRKAAQAERLGQARTGERQLAVSFDRLRAAAYRHPARGDECHRLAELLLAEAMKLEAA